MCRFLLTLSFILGIVSFVSAQTATDSVRQVVSHFFDAMRATDTSQLRKLMTASVIFQTVRSQSNGKSSAINESVDQFLKTIAQLKPGEADEQIEFSSVNVEGVLASVWTPYRFYFNNQFSHCGVNSFSLIKSGEHWQIHYIIDTRHKTNCSPLSSK